jgi:hypothetical protein
VKQLFPKALLYKEWKNARWGFVLITFFLVLSNLLEAMQRLSYLKELANRGELEVTNHAYWLQLSLYGNDGVFAWLFILTAALAFLLFYQDRQGATASLITSMPFTKEQAFNVKWLTGAGVIVGAFLVNGLLFTGFYFANRSWMFETPYQVIPTWTAIALAFALAAFSFLLFVQCAMGHSLAAAVVGPIASLVPWFVLSGLRDIIFDRFGLSYHNALINWLSRAANAVAWPRLLLPVYVLSPSGIYYTGYDNVPGRVLVMVIIAAICMWLGRVAYRKSAVEKSGQLLMFSSLEPVLIYGFAICLSLLVSLVFGRGFVAEDNVLVMDAFLLAGFIGGWWLAKRVVVYYQH